MRMGLESKTLSWFGDQVFGVYILQRLSMEFGKCFRWNEKSIHLYFLFCLIATLLLAVAFGKLTRFLDSKWFGGAASPPGGSRHPPGDDGTRPPPCHAACFSPRRKAAKTASNSRNAPTRNAKDMPR